MKGPSDALSRDQKIDLIALIVLIGFGASVAYHYVLSAYLDMGYPFNTFLFDPAYSFKDMLVFSGQLGHVVHDGMWNYPPFTYLIIYPFSVLPKGLALGLFLALFAASFTYVAARNLRQDSVLATTRNVFILGFLSYPFLFTFDRANNEWMLFLLLYFFVVCYSQERRILGPVFLALAISMKIFPAVFLVLFFVGRRNREIARTLVFTAAFTLLGFVVFDGGPVANWHRFLQSTGAYTVGHGYWGLGWRFGNSLFGAARLLLLESAGVDVGKSTLFLAAYSGIALLAFLALWLFLARRKVHFWKQVLLLVAAMNLLPQVSADYKLLHLFIPLFLFVNQDQPEKSDLLYAVLFALLLVPKDYARLSGRPEVSLSVFLNPLIMLLMAVTVFVERAQERPAVKVADDVAGSLAPCTEEAG